MVAVHHQVSLPASPPPSPPRQPDMTSAKIRAAPIPSPDTSRDDLKDDKELAPRLNDFELIRVLGKGCAGRVLLVKHTSTSRVHAMKAISKRAVLANDELDHTLAEQEILRQFATHDRRSPFISRLYYSFTDQENFYLVMEFYPGGDLATQMEIHGILGPLRTRFYACDIVAGLEALHKEGVLVRDLKPENILLNWHGHAVLADFGLSKSFGYRGNPVPVKLPRDYIEGKGTPPAYAGKGFGSYREGELTWDRAYSFVGTQEYLAPEVIKRHHYTYAIDWWALGCIVCECLTGRVPFRGQEDESNAELYERVLNAPWDAMYRGDRPTSYLKEAYRIDAMTYDFIDGLLQKEPMFRLTEPSVRSHSYFTNVDWDTVLKGDYQDPFQLDIDPVAEYNTQFFPRLCLEETPTVDMTGHDSGKDAGEQSALNNDDIYAKAQAEFHRELEGFSWTCDRAEEDVVSDVEMGEEEEEREEVVEVDDDDDEMLEEASELDSELEQEQEPAPAPKSELSEPAPQSPQDPVVDIPAESPISLRHQASVASVASVASAAVSVPAQALSPKAPSMVLPPPDSPSVATAMASLSVPSLSVQVADDIPSLPTPELRPITLHEDDMETLLPVEAPSSGLSVSDVIAIPSSQGSPNLIIRRHRQVPSIDSFPHARLSVDLNGHFGALGDEDWEQLDSQAIPELQNGANEAGQHTGVFARRLANALGRRPSSRGLGRRTNSTLRAPSGLRNASGSTSGSGTSSERSPTKSRPPLFAARGLENTKRAFTRIKAFPTAKDSLRPSASTTASASAATSTATSPVASIRGVQPILETPMPPRPSSTREPSYEATVKRSSFVAALTPGKRGTSRSGDLGGLFSRPKRRADRSGANSRSSVSGESSTTVESAHVPRVELNPTPPIVWELLDKE